MDGAPTGHATSPQAAGPGRLVVLYLLTPFLRLVVRHATHRRQAAFGGVLLGLGAVDQVLASFLDVGGASAATRFLPYAGCFTLGRLLRDVPLTRRARVPVPSVVVEVALGLRPAARLGLHTPGPSATASAFSL